MSNESELETAIERQRRLLESRFRSDYDWLRLVFLGAILIAISAVALADALAVQHLSGHFSGSSAIFGGMAIALFVTKIARGALYLDCRGPNLDRSDSVSRGGQVGFCAPDVLLYSEGSGSPSPGFLLCR
jgi:hypothetical protein